MAALAHQRGVKVLEDCSQSHGAKWQGKPIGTFGDLAAFSTMYRKNHATGGQRKSAEQKACRTLLGTGPKT